MAEERAIAFEALNQALQTVARSRLFKDYNEAEMHAIFNVLRSGNRRGQTQASIARSASLKPLSALTYAASSCFTETQAANARR